MIPLAAVSVALLLLASVGAAVWLVRGGEIRIWLLLAALLLLAAGQAIALRARPPSALAFDLATLGELAVLAASVAAVLLVLAMGWTAAERDRAENLHWDSMETVRALGELARRGGLDFDGRLAEVIRTGCSRFGLEVGGVARVAGRRWELVALRAPSDLGLARGTVLDVSETLCAQTLAGGRFARARAGPAGARAGPEPRLVFEAYLGAEIRSGDRSFGTLWFASRKPRQRPFTATDKDLLALMAQWVGFEIDRAVAAELLRGAHLSGRAERARTETVQPRGARGNGAVDLNAELRALHRDLRRLGADTRRVELALAPELPPALAGRLPLRPLLAGVVTRALAALPAEASLRLATAALPAPPVPGHRPGEAGAHVTLALRASGAELDTERLAAALESGGSPGASPAARDAAAALPLPALRRIVQRAGGDVSLEVEAGRAATLTLFLRAAAPAPPERAQPRARA